jgi:hypothetical protein
MSAQPDLFETRYPIIPGHRRTATSRDAALSIAPRAPILRERILTLLRAGYELTPDEAAEKLGASLLATRPRFSELDRLLKIVPTGETRANAVSGHRANVYRIASGGLR